MDIAAFKTLDEFKYVSDMCKQNENLLTKWVHVGGVTLTPQSSSDWYWVATGEKIAYDMPWHTQQPNNAHENNFVWLLGKVISCLMIPIATKNTRINSFVNL
jgi:hypothetical protein